MINEDVRPCKVLSFFFNVFTSIFRLRILNTVTKRHEYLITSSKILQTCHI